MTNQIKILAHTADPPVTFGMGQCFQMLGILLLNFQLNLLWFTAQGFLT